MEYISLYTRVDRSWSSVLELLVSGQWERSSGFSGGGEIHRLEGTCPASFRASGYRNFAQDYPSGSIRGLER